MRTQFGRFPGTTGLYLPPDVEPDEPDPTGAPTRTSRGVFPQKSYSNTVTLSNLQTGTGAAANNQNILAQAAATAGVKHIIPPGTWYHNGIISFRGAGCGFFGAGIDVSTLHATNPDLATFRVEANDVWFEDFTHKVSEVRLTRSSQGQHGAGNIFVNPNIFRFTAQRVKAWGSRDAAWHFYNAKDYKLNQCISKNSGSDAIHNMQLATGFEIYDWVTEDCNDDMMGFVGYSTVGPSGLVVRTSLKRQSHGRGLGLVHCQNIEFVGPILIEDSAAAAVIFAREPQYAGENTNCPSVANIKFTGELRIRRGNHDETKNHGAICFANPTAATNNIRDILIEGPVIIEDTNFDRDTSASAQVYAPQRTGYIGAEIRDTSFYSSIAKTAIPLFDGPSTIVRGVGFDNSYSALPAPPYPLPA